MSQLNHQPDRHIYGSIVVARGDMASSMSLAWGGHLCGEEDFLGFFFSLSNCCLALSATAEEAEREGSDFSAIHSSPD